VARFGPAGLRIDPAVADTIARKRVFTGSPETISGYHAKIRNFYRHVLRSLLEPPRCKPELFVPCAP
jgi:hypothetical protein